MRKRSDFRKYQEIGLSHILRVPRGALFIEMGLGKTVTTLTGFKELCDMLECSKALVIAPKRVAESVWSDEVLEWEHLKHLKVVPITGTPDKRIKLLKEKADIHAISIDNAQWLLGYKGSFKDYDMIILDESSMMKNHDTKRFKVLKKALTKSPRLVLLTGTPTPNSLLELWPQLYLIDGGQRLYPFITKFRQVYAEPNRSGYGYNIREGFDKHILRLIKDVCLSIRAKDFGFTIPVVNNIIKCHLDEKTQAMYKQFKKDLIYEFYLNNADEEGNVTVTAVNAAVLSNKLLQFANGAMYDAERNVVNLHYEKVEALRSLFNEIHSPILVAYNYEFDKDRIMALAKSMGKKAEVFKKAEQIAKWNRGEIDILVMHPKSGGHGLNLQFGGHHIIWYGQTHSTETEQQLNARLARSGQKNTVIIHQIITYGTIEQDIMPKTDKKKSVQDAVLEYLKDYRTKKV